MALNKIPSTENRPLLCCESAHGFLNFEPKFSEFVRDSNKAKKYF